MSNIEKVLDCGGPYKVRTATVHYITGGEGHTLAVIPGPDGQYHWFPWVGELPDPEKCAYDAEPASAGHLFERMKEAFTNPFAPVNPFDFGGAGEKK